MIAPCIVITLLWVKLLMMVYTLLCPAYILPSLVLLMVLVWNCACILIGILVSKSFSTIVRTLITGVYCFSFTGLLTIGWLYIGGMGLEAPLIPIAIPSLSVITSYSYVAMNYIVNFILGPNHWAYKIGIYIDRSKVNLICNVNRGLCLSFS